MCRAAPVGAQVPWTTWGRFVHDSPRARVEVHLPCVLESRSAGQRALAPPTDGHPPDFRQPQRQFNHYTTAFQPRHGHNQPPLNHNLFTTISPTIKQPLPNPALTIGNLDPSTTVLQPLFYPRTRKTLLQPPPTAAPSRRKMAGPSLAFGSPYANSAISQPRHGCPQPPRNHEPIGFHVHV